jgi:hypothetical protein
LKKIPGSPLRAPRNDVKAGLLRRGPPIRVLVAMTMVDAASGGPHVIPDNALGALIRNLAGLKKIPGSLAPLAPRNDEDARRRRYRDVGSFACVPAVILNASWPGIAVRRTASLRSAYDTAIHAFPVARSPRRGCAGQARA